MCIPASPEESYQNAKHVFIGKVIATDANLDYYIAYNRPSFITWDSWQKYVIPFLNPKGPQTYTLTVLTSWKGIITQQVIIKNQDSCGRYTFEKGERYLVYAGEYNNYISTHVCYGTKPLNKAGQDLRVLGKGRIIAVDEPESSFFAQINYFVIFSISLFVLILLSGTMLYWCTRKIGLR